MADFKTHMLGAALVSGVAATGIAMVSDIGPSAVLGLFALGVVGGILPDIDSDTSIPIRVAFNVLSVIAGFLVVFRFSEVYSLLELLVLGLAGFALVRFGIFSAFTRFTVHRGLFHSIPAALVAGMITAIIAHELFNAHPVKAWSWGSFVFGGFLVHLILDEIYSVDLMGMQVKRSFGTALNFGSVNNPWGTLMLYGFAAVLFFFCPPYSDFINTVTDSTAYQYLGNRLLPNGAWFSGFFNGSI